MDNYDDFYSAADDIYKCLKRDLLGPAEEHEVLENVEPLSAYVCGILWPRRAGGRANEADEHEAALSAAAREDVEDLEDLVASADDTIEGANIYEPTSMGISLMLPDSAAKLHITFSGARYRHEAEDDGRRVVHRYTRVPFSVQSEADIGSNPETKKIAGGEGSGVEIILTLRNFLKDGGKLVTVTAQNTVHAKSIDRNTGALFQCELLVSSDAALLPVYRNNALVSDAEEKISQLQYRNVMNFTYGHGCSTSYSETPDGVFEVKSDFMPKERVYQMMPGATDNRDILNLSYWAGAPRSSACAGLSRFEEEYERWREGQFALSRGIADSSYREAGDRVLARIDRCIARLRGGIKILENDDMAWRAFVLMNRAMLLQRVKTKGGSEQSANWYPFQLAYILQIIPDIAGDAGGFRECVDLLWFPTGGGKTEAYLGVAAFVIFYRRLSGKMASDGVTVIMRYTLRLLTIQQFERATALICACEHIRRREDIGGGEINIGLWIGSGMTPNRIEQARTVLNKLRENISEKIYEGNPVQVTKCPWCGQKLDLNSYEIRDNALLIRCADNPSCEYHSGLPIYVVDEDIYRVCPTLLLSTIDKFARIAWEENTRSLFGVGCPPPELIIQDELHLISGPLGSLAGIYEVALEYLCGKTGKRPKIIASTATVKNAKEQIRNLYNKRTVQFPPAGINYDDSFFAVKADADKRPARTYVGLCEMGGSIADLMIRVYAVLFFTKALFIRQGRDDGVIDQYFTTIGYFNTLKDLGASSSIIQDRIFMHIRNLIARTFKPESEQYRISPTDVKIFEHSELTSRKSAKEIRDTLDQLTRRFSEPGCYSYVLASNMLSVGIDIDRLGVMTVYNQPKSNAEYIQATSRVGRHNPGVILAMYNNMRSRDKSHYEQFGYYHKSFYRYVEATSVTPFSMRVIEKAIHCIFVALIRLTVPMLSHNDSARHFKADMGGVEKIRDYLVKRVGDIMPEHADFAAEVIDDFAGDWEYVAEENRNTLCYKSYDGQPSLLSSAEEDSPLGLPKILNSLRNVDPTVNVYFRR